MRQGGRRCRLAALSILNVDQAPVAQLDRALPSEGRGQGFESLRARQLNQWFNAGTGQHSKEPSKRIASRRSNLERCFRRIAGTSEWSGILHYLESMHST